MVTLAFLSIMWNVFVFMFILSRIKVLRAEVDFLFHRLARLEKEPDSYDEADWWKEQER